MTLDQLAQHIDAELAGDASLDIHACATLEDARPGQVSFLANPKYLKQLQTTQASAVIVAPSVNSDRLSLLKAKDPYFAFRQAMVALHGFRKHPHAGIHPAAHVDPTAAVGEGSVLYPGVYVGPRARIGRDCILYPNAVVYDDCILGDRVIVHSGTAVGTDGFGYATHRGEHHKIPQIGNVIVEDDVELGANCAIERATVGSTVIGKGSKLCDLVEIAHGAKLGAHCLLVAQVGIAGSATIGHHATIAGQAGVVGHLKIGDNVTIGAKAVVTNNVADKSTVMGFPAMPVHHGRRVYALFTQLPELAQRIKQLEAKLESLETKAK